MPFVSEDAYWAAFEINGVQLGLHWNEGSQVPKVSFDAHGAHCGATLTLATDNILEDTIWLQKNNVEVVGQLDELWGKLTVFKDIDGNILKLMEVKTSG